MFASALLVTAAAPLAAQTAQAPAPAAKPAELPTARVVIDRHIEAVGGRAVIMKHSSTHLKGTISIPSAGISGPFEVFAAKPNKMTSKATLAGLGDFIEGYDGKIAWSVNPSTGPMLAQGKELEQKKFDADFYGDLRESGKYESMTVTEQTTFDGRPCYKVTLVRKGGGEDIEYYDVATGLKAGATMTRESPMGAITVTQIQTDYKKFGDLMQPSTLKQSAMGMEQIITITSAEYDKVDPAVFELPAVIKGLVK
jgi:hypothetical protein